MSVKHLPTPPEVSTLVPVYDRATEVSPVKTRLFHHHINS